MSKIDTGGPAFPCTEAEYVPHGLGAPGTQRRVEHLRPGMTLLDYFAEGAMRAIIGKIPALKDRDPNNVAPFMEMVSEEAGAQIRKAAAQLAWKYAQDMVNERKRLLGE